MHGQGSLERWRQIQHSKSHGQETPVDNWINNRWKDERFGDDTWEI